ncbi:hypothetical protein BJ546DRAFT_400713 [Cryomyces antarcticus]
MSATGVDVMHGSCGVSFERPLCDVLGALQSLLPIGACSGTGSVRRSKLPCLEAAGCSTIWPARCTHDARQVSGEWRVESGEWANPRPGAVAVAVAGAVAVAIAVARAGNDATRCSSPTRPAAYSMADAARDRQGCLQFPPKTSDMPPVPSADTDMPQRSLNGHELQMQFSTISRATSALAYPRPCPCPCPWRRGPTSTVGKQESCLVVLRTTDLCVSLSTLPAAFGHDMRLGRNALLFKTHSDDDATLPSLFQSTPLLAPITPRLSEPCQSACPSFILTLPRLQGDLAASRESLFNHGTLTSRCRAASVVCAAVETSRRMN